MAVPATVIEGLCDMPPVGLPRHTIAAPEMRLEGGIPLELGFRLHRYIHNPIILHFYLHNDSSSVDHHLSHWLTYYPLTPKEC